jgi:hypothetical protein
MINQTTVRTLVKPALKADMLRSKNCLRPTLKPPGETGSQTNSGLGKPTDVCRFGGVN